MGKYYLLTKQQFSHIRPTVFLQFTKQTFVILHNF